jgi:hypothetical protein
LTHRPEFDTGTDGITGKRETDIDVMHLRDRPRIERKRRLKQTMPRVELRLRYVQHGRGRSIDRFRGARELTTWEPDTSVRIKRGVLGANRV